MNRLKTDTWEVNPPDLSLRAHGRTHSSHCRSQYFLFTLYIRAPEFFLYLIFTGVYSVHSSTAPLASDYFLWYSREENNCWDWPENKTLPFMECQEYLHAWTVGGVKWKWKILNKIDRVKFNNFILLFWKFQSLKEYVVGQKVEIVGSN